jgi:serine phosphatase RsbU (regulator of sigma subunit)
MAELARVEGRPEDAVQYYLKAIDCSQKYSFIHIVAYAMERYAKYLLSLGDTVSARVYLIKARKAYEDWGARLKVQQLSKNYALLLAEDLLNENSSSERSPQLSTGTLDGAVDTKTMVRASQSLSSKMILDDLIEDLMRVTMENAGATHGFMAIMQGEKLLLRLEAVAQDRIRVVRMEETAVESLRVPQRVIQYVINTKRALVLDDAVDEGVFSGDPYIAYSRVKSLLCQPILHQGELIGILCLENHLIARAFTQDRVELLGVLAAQTAISMKNTQYVAQVADKARLESQVMAAQAVHLTLLPKNPAPPEVSIAMHYHSADQIGGDWVTYDFDTQAGRIFLCVGDVTGHGIPSALVTAAAAGAFKATVMSFGSEKFQRTAREKPSMESMDLALVRLATAVNKTVHETGSQVKRDMTMAFVAVDLWTGDGAYINAAHLPILHLSQDHAATLTATSSMLGLDQNAQFTVKRFRMNLGDRLFIFTDGLTENRGPTGQKLKLIQVRNILLGCPEPTYAAKTILEQARFIWRAEKPKDDCSFLIMRWDKSLSDGDEDQDGSQPTDLSA